MLMWAILTFLQEHQLNSNMICDNQVAKYIGQLKIRTAHLVLVSICSALQPAGGVTSRDVTTICQFRYHTKAVVKSPFTTVCFQLMECCITQGWFKW